MYDIDDMNQLNLNDVLLNGGQKQKKHYAILEIGTSHPCPPSPKADSGFPLL